MMLGALKVTPAHDLRDFELAERHKLNMLNIFDDSGVANEHCGEFRVHYILNHSSE